MAAQRKTRGPNDPDRPARIAAAAIEVVAEHGIERLTHRAVAAAADIPLGSTTYHFATLDDLLAAALRLAADRNVQRLRDWAGALPRNADLAVALADLVLGSLAGDRTHTVVEYDLYVAALHRPALRPVSAAWDEELIHVFGSRTDPLTGRVLAGLFCGLLMQAALADPPPSRRELTALFRRAIAG